MSFWILLKAGTNMWVHCDLNEFITLNEQMEEEATTRPGILHFFGQEKFIFFRKQSANLEKLCIFMYQWNNYFQLNIPLNIQLFTTLYSGKWLDLLMTVIIVYCKWRILKVKLLKKYIYSRTSRKRPTKMSSLGGHIQASIVSSVFPICPIF